MSDFEIQNSKKSHKFQGNVPVLSLLKDCPQLLRGRPGNLFYISLYFLYIFHNPNIYHFIIINFLKTYHHNSIACNSLIMRSPLGPSLGLVIHLENFTTAWLL